MSKDVYQSFWTLVIGESLLSKPQPDNPEDKYVACVKKNTIVGHLTLGISGKFAKTFFYFLRADELNSCKIVVTGKPVNSSNGKYVVLLPFLPSMQPPI